MRIVVKSILILVISIITLQKTFCQENYLPGYIISLKGDTIKGIIDYPDKKHNPTKIYFKESDTEELNVYTPQAIKLFSVKNLVYVSATVEREVSLTLLTQLQAKDDFEIVRDTVFLNVEFEGAKSLFSFKPVKGNTNFYIKKYGVYELLKYKKFLSKIDGKEGVVESKVYLGQLILYLNENIAIQSQIKNTEYTRKDLRKLFEKYYNLTKSNPEFKRNKDKVILEKGILAGATLSTLMIGSNQFEDTDSDFKFKQKQDFSIGIFYDVLLPYNQRKWSINNELLLGQYKLDGEYIDSENNFNGDATYTYLQMNNLVRYKQPIGKIAIYANIGLSSRIVINDSYSFDNQVADRYLDQSILNDELSSVDKSSFDIIGGIGVKLKQYSLELRYAGANKDILFPASNSTANKIRFLIGYRF